MHNPEEMAKQPAAAPEAPEEKAGDAGQESVTKFIAPDGTVWNSHEDYLAYVQGQK